MLSCSVSKQTSSLNLFQGESAGCGNFIVYKLSTDGIQYISVSVNANEIEFEDSYAQVDAQDIEVRWKKFSGDISASICNDVIVDRPELLINQVAKTGSITITVIDSEQEKKENDQPYKVTVVLKNIVFENLTVDYLQLENVVVGWLPG